MVTHGGGCHCGAVAFEVDAPAQLDVVECNCSICGPTAYQHLIVPRERFRLLRGEESLSTYTFGTRTARHLFCRSCGVKSFYVPRSHPDGVSVNARCLTPGTVESISMRPSTARTGRRRATLSIATPRGEISLATSDAEIAACFPVMHELRTNLVEAEFVARVRRQQRRRLPARAGARRRRARRGCRLSPVSRLSPGGASSTSTIS